MVPMMIDVEHEAPGERNVYDYTQRDMLLDLIGSDGLMKVLGLNVLHLHKRSNNLCSTQAPITRRHDFSGRTTCMQSPLLYVESES
jgi:hypothetical protein